MTSTAIAIFVHSQMQICEIVTTDSSILGGPSKGRICQIVSQQQRDEKILIDDVVVA